MEYPSALGENFAASWEDAYRALKDNVCKVITNPSSAYQAGNSLLVCGPQMRTDELFGKAPCYTAISLVCIVGSEHEPLHTHTSHVITWIVAGKGWLLTPATQLIATPGNLVVIPRGAPHCFNCPIGGEVLLAGMELSDQELDYQKNFYEK